MTITSLHTRRQRLRIFLKTTHDALREYHEAPEFDATPLGMLDAVRWLIDLDVSPRAGQVWWLTILDPEGAEVAHRKVSHKGKRTTTGIRTPTLRAVRHLVSRENFSRLCDHQCEPDPRGSVQ